MARRSRTKREDPNKTGLVNRKVAPKLRLFANGDEEVCLARAEHDPALAVTSDAPVATTPRLRSPFGATPPTKRQKYGKGTLDQVVHSAKASLFIHFNEDAPDTQRTQGVSRRRGTIATAEVPLSEVASMAQRSDVTHIEVGDIIRVPPVVLSSHLGGTAAPPLSERKIRSQSRRHDYGAGVLIGIIDVGGIAFAHPDFLVDGETRVARLWDMGGSTRSSPRGFDYGSEFRAEHFNAAIAAASSIGVSPYAIEPQAHQQRSSHATHVASIAAGNRGICRKAELACVMLDLAPQDADRRRSFYDSARIAHAVDYLISVAEELGQERQLDGPMPLSINISLGTNGHAHDGSSAVSRWIDHALVLPGRVVSVAAGNAGQDSPSFPGDLGYVTGRIHSSGRIGARGLTNSMDWIVVGDGSADISENEMEIWYEPQDRFSVVVTSPGPEPEQIGPVHPGQYIENRQLSDGTFISIYNELYRPANGANTISIYLTPRLKSPLIGVQPGEWRVSLRGEDVRDGRYHVWIERDDPGPHIRRNGMAYSALPSFFSQRSHVDAYTVSSLACGERILAVGNFDGTKRRVNVSSSQGPTRTNGMKPEVLAPGTDVIAANGFASAPWIGMTGTSMASPYAAGVAGLMLAVAPTLTAAQIIGIMRRTAEPMEDSDFGWKSDNGFGLLDPAACLEEAARVNERSDIT
ncbi:MAG: S8 family serine peptidase [Myxococcota bacterium]